MKNQEIEITPEIMAIAMALYYALKATPKAFVLGRPPEPTIVDGTFDLAAIAATLKAGAPA